MAAPQLSLFEAARYHDPRIAADRARARSLAKLRPARRCERVELERPASLADARARRDRATGPVRRAA